LRQTRGIPLELLINLVLGLGFSWCGRDRIRADGPFSPPAFHLVATFAAILIGPITLYLYATHPAWSWMYLVDPDKLPGLLLLPVTIGQVVAVLVGWWVGALLLRARLKRVLAACAGVGSVLALLVLFLGRGRLGTYGSFDDFTAGRSLDLMQVKLGYVLVAIGLGALASGVYLALQLLRDSRRVRAKN
jgi:hypothetical protein